MEKEKIEILKLINKFNILESAIGHLISIINKSDYQDISNLTAVIRDIRNIKEDIKNYKLENYINKFDIRRKIWLESLITSENTEIDLILPIGSKSATFAHYVADLVTEALYHYLELKINYHLNEDIEEYLGVLRSYFLELFDTINKNLYYIAVY